MFRYHETDRNLPALELLRRIGCTELSTSKSGHFFTLTTQDALSCLEAASDRWTRLQQEVAARPETTVVQRSSQVALFADADLARIARELHSPEQVLSAIEKRRPAASAITGAAPRTPTERIVEEIWCDLLNVPFVPVDLNFFEAGGSSMLSVRVLSEIRRRFSIEMPMTAFFTREPTIAEIAAAIENQQIAESNPEDTSALLDDLESLSDETIRHLLAKER